jgi:predicted DNA-binding transcriptional regulator YafY
MPVNKNAFLRYRIIDKCLNNKFKRYNRKTLTEKVRKDLEMQISESTVDKDIYAMKNEMDAPIVFDKFSDCYRYSSPFSLAEIVIDDVEEKSLNTSLAILDVLKDTQIAQAYKGIIQRLVTQVEYKGANFIEFEQNNDKQELKWFDDLVNAIIEKKAIQLQYQAYGQNPKEHVVSPYMIKEYRNRFYLVAYRHSKQQEQQHIIIFGLDRIKSVKQSKEVFIPTKGFNSKQYFKHSLGITRSLEDAPIELILKFDKINIPYVLSKPLHKSQRILEQTENYVIINITVYESHELNMTILSYGAGVEVLSPSHYIDYITLTAKKMLSLYKAKKN